jgi:anti-sigma B factor antagonist
MRAFRISERDLDPECRELRLEGELDLSVADRFQARLDAAVVDDVEVLVCLDECEFIDSTGIAVIVLAYKLMAAKGRRLLVCHPSAEVSRVLALTGLTDEGIVFDGSDGALSERFFGHVASRPFRAEEPRAAALPVSQGSLLRRVP